MGYGCAWCMGRRRCRRRLLLLHLHLRHHHRHRFRHSHRSDRLEMHHQKFRFHQIMAAP